MSVHATHARLTPGDIAEARERLEELEFAFDEAGDDLDRPVIDEETQALLHRAQTLLDNNSLEAAQATELQELMADVVAAESQDELDDLSEELLDLLFDLE